MKRLNMLYHNLCVSCCVDAKKKRVVVAVLLMNFVYFNKLGLRMSYIDAVIALCPLYILHLVWTVHTKLNSPHDG